MSGKKSTPKNKNLSQFGLLDFTSMDEDIDDLSDDDLSLEAELAALSGSGASRPKARPAAPVNVNLDAMVAESLRDEPSDEDISDGDDDPDLLNELRQLSVEEDDAAPLPPPRIRPAPPPPTQEGANPTVKLLQERIENYTLAEKNALASNESSRARRFNRGLKTLKDMLKHAQSGKSVNESEIPPPVSVGKGSTVQEPKVSPESLPPTQPEPQNPGQVETKQESLSQEDSEMRDVGKSSENNQTNDRAKGMECIKKRQLEFKTAFLVCKKNNETDMGEQFRSIAEKLDIVLEQYNLGVEMDLSELPTVQQIIAEYKSSHSPASPPPQAVSTPAHAITVEDALRQRLAVYQEQESRAREQNNSSKQRRMARIVKQYEDAIKLHAAGKPIPVDELPTPPGFGPLPGPAGAKIEPKADVPSSPVSSGPSASQDARVDRQLAVILLRQKQFKEAAIKAKKQGNVAEAKEHLRNAKGYEALAVSIRKGAAVDVNKLPLPPKPVSPQTAHVEDSFEVVSTEECHPDNDDVMCRLLQQLTTQLQLCVTTGEHYKAMGNVAETKRFQMLGRTVKQDLDVVKNIKRLGGGVPLKFHYENRRFSVIQCNTDLNENDLELFIVRGIAYNVPNPREVDTYVRFEFPYPQDAPVSDRTSTVKDTNSPTYDSVFPLHIQRSARPCLRVFKRHAIKFEVYSKGGWFSKDTVLGTASLKLAPLETQTTIHESVPLMDGRRPAGGSLEVRLRIRTPLLQQHFDNTEHRWLIIDH